VSAAVVVEVRGAVARRREQGAPGRDLGMAASGDDEARQRSEVEGATGVAPRGTATGTQRGRSRCGAGY
jgi:hypothetical protein